MNLNVSILKQIVQFLGFFILIWLTVSISCRKEYSCENCNLTNKLPINKSPIAVAGPDQTITLPLNSAVLDGSTSSDPDSNIVSYKWTKISGPSSFNVANGTTVQAQITNLFQGTYLFELLVTDAGGLFSMDTVRVTVKSSSGNIPPEADAGPDQKRIIGTGNIKLDGSASKDVDGTIVSSLWTKIGGPVQGNIHVPPLPVTAFSDFTEGIYVFRLLVTDDQGATDDDTVKIEVVRNSLSGREIIYDAIWGCNDVCSDGDVYWTPQPDPANPLLYFDPNTPLEVSLLLDTSTTWISVLHRDSPLPPINQFFFYIYDNLVWVYAYDAKFITTRVTIKVKFL